jgi:type I restriction enzyme S subunit
MTKQTSEIPKGWKKTTLRDEVKEIIDNRGRNPEAYSSKGIPVIDNVLITGERKIDLDQTKRFIDEATYSSFIRKYTKEGDVLITLVGNGYGNIALSPKQKSAIIQNTIGLRFDTVTSNNFIFYYLSLNKRLITNLTIGAAQPSVKVGDLLNINVLLPPISERRAITAVLSPLDDKIELLREQNKTLEATAQTIFREWFVKFNFPGATGKTVDSELGKIPESWRLGNLGEVIKFINGYAFKSSELLDSPTANCYKIFKMGNIKKGGGFDPFKTKSYIEKENYNGNDKYVLRKGDLLMSMTDMKDAISLLGHTALMTTDNEYVVNQRVGLIRTSNDLNVKYPFLYLLTNSAEFLGKLRGRAHSGVQVNLSTEAIKRTPFIIPDKKTNQQFNNVAEPLFDKMMSNELQIQTLSSLRDTLLPKLMKGEIRVKGFQG